MQNIPTNSTNATSVHQQANSNISSSGSLLPNTSAPPLAQQSSSREKDKSEKVSATPADGLAVAGMFIGVGIFAGYFPTFAHLPSMQGLCQFLAYTFYGFGFLGGCFELSKLSKSQFFETFGIGGIGFLIAFGLGFLAELANKFFILSLILQILVVLSVALGSYGVVRGIMYLLIRENSPLASNQHTQSSGQQNSNPQIKEKMKPEQKAGIFIAALSVVTALIQTLPSIILLFKQLFHIP